MQVRELPVWGTHPHVGGQNVPRPQGQKPLHLGPFRTLPCAPLRLDVHLCPSLSSRLASGVCNISSSSASHENGLLKLRVGMGTLSL